MSHDVKPASDEDTEENEARTTGSLHRGIHPEPKRHGAKTMQKIAWSTKKIHNYSEEKEMANICSTALFNKTEATVDHSVGQQFLKSLLFPCLQEPAYQKSSPPKKTMNPNFVHSLSAMQNASLRGK